MNGLLWNGFSGCTCTSLGKQNTGKCSSGLGQNSGGNSGNSWKKINSALQRKRQDSVLKIGTSICNLFLVILEWLLCLSFRSLGGRNSLSWFGKISDETSGNSRKKISPTESKKIIKKLVLVFVSVYNSGQIDPSALLIGTVLYVFDNHSFEMNGNEFLWLWSVEQLSTL